MNIKKTVFRLTEDFSKGDIEKAKQMGRRQFMIDRVNYPIPLANVHLMNMLKGAKIGGGGKELMLAYSNEWKRLRNVLDDIVFLLPEIAKKHGYSVGKYDSVYKGTPGHYLFVNFEYNVDANKEELLLVWNREGNQTKKYTVSSRETGMPLEQKNVKSILEKIIAKGDDKVQKFLPKG